MSESPSFVVPPAQGQQQQDTTVPRFYIKPVQNNFRSEQEGRPIFEDMEYVEIAIPGDMRAVVDRRVKPEDKARWPKYYEAFKANQEFFGEGLPLTEWSGVTRSQVEELRFFKIRTVEQLAAIDDANLAALGHGGRTLRSQAQAFLESAKGGEPAAKLIADGAAKDEKIKALEEEVSQMKAQLATLMKKDGANGPARD